MIWLLNLGSPIPTRTGAVYELVKTVRGFKLENRKGQHFTPRGFYKFVRRSGFTWVSKRGEHVHISQAEPVHYAGEIRFGYNRAWRGRIRHWNNASGHYLPPPALAHQAGLPLGAFVEADLS